MQYSRVTKSFTIEYAHRLQNHPGKCRNIHGHQGRIEVTIEGPLNDQGMVVDFGDLSSTVGRFLSDTLDHTLILDKNDPIKVNDGSISIVLVDGPPTAELLASVIGEAIIYQNLLPIRHPSLRVLAVRFWETPTAYAEYIP